MRADDQPGRGTNRHRAHFARRRPQSTCSVKVGDGLNLPVKAVHEHLARRVLTGETGRVLDRIVELRVEVELLSTPTAQPRAIFLFDYPKEERGHAYNSRRRQPNNEGPEVLTIAPFVRATKGGHRGADEVPQRTLCESLWQLVLAVGFGRSV
jgi:hypothetical protein